jgi:hypothetical protein
MLEERFHNKFTATCAVFITEVTTTDLKVSVKQEEESSPLLPCSPDLAPSDFHLLVRLGMYSEGRRRAETPVMLQQRFLRDRQTASHAKMKKMC